MSKGVIRFISVVVIITGLAFWTCHPPKTDPQLYIAISKYMDNDHYNQYKTWLQRTDSQIVLVDMYHLPLDSALRMLENCSGLLMSGGADIHPNQYQQPEDSILCETDLYRDTLEMALLNKAKELHLPILGICRGLQVINVYMGGSLYPDIPQRLGTTVKHRHADQSFDCTHPVQVIPGSYLAALTKVGQSEVNSSHHQGIDRLAEGLTPSAYSPDSLIEAIEFMDTTDVPFFLAVQWHPERLSPGHPMSDPMAKEFIRAVKNYQKRNQISGKN